MDFSEQLMVSVDRVPQKRESGVIREDRPLKETIRYETAEAFLKDISYGGSLYERTHRQMVFRGLQSGTYELVPSVLRHKRVLKNMDGTEYVEDEDAPIKIADSEWVQREMEYLSLRNFFEICDENGLRLPDIEKIRKYLYSYKDMGSVVRMRSEWLPYDLLELAALAQHYGLETRLLDWTGSIDTAIYFAAHSEPSLSEEERQKEKSKYMVIWMLDTAIEHKSESLRLIRPPYHGNPNLAAQKGLFTYWKEPGFKISSNVISQEEVIELHKEPINRMPLDQRLEAEFGETKLDRTYLWEFLLPCEGRKTLYDYIVKKGVSAASLFPGYAGVALSMKEARSFQ